MTASEELALEAERQASSREGMAALIHALLADTEQSAGTWPHLERELRNLIRSYVLTKRQSAMRPITSHTAARVASLKSSIAELGERLGPETFAAVKKRVGTGLSFGLVRPTWQGV
jgi:hypothetical protein